MKKSIYNILFGVLGQIVTIAIGLFLPRLRIISFGSEVNGMLSSVQQVFTYLALLEAGVGSASLQSLYGPIAKGDKNEINKILVATHSYYKKTGFFYVISVFFFAFAYPFIVASNIPASTIVAVILLNGLGNALRYFFQGKYIILLQAEGKQYIITNIATFVNIATNILKVILLLSGCNVIALQAVYFVFNIVQVIYFAWYIKRHYKWIDLKVEGNYKAISQKNSVLIHQISQLVFNHTDVLILTLFCDLKVVSVYAVYTLVYDIVSVVLNHVTSGFSYKLGQLFNSAYEKFIKLYDIIEPYYIALSFSLYCIVHIFVLNFIELYTSGVSDTQYTLKYLPVLFTSFKLLVSGRATSGFVQTYAGHFKKTQGRAIIEAVINLTVSLIMVNVCGIYGVLIGTVASLLYRANDMIIYTNRVILQRSPWHTYKHWVLNLVIFISIVFASRFIIPSNLNSYFDLILVGAISGITILIIFIGVTFIATYKQSKEVLSWLLSRYIKKSSV